MVNETPPVTVPALLSPLQPPVGGVDLKNVAVKFEDGESALHVAVMLSAPLKFPFVLHIAFS